MNQRLGIALLIALLGVAGCGSDSTDGGAGAGGSGGSSPAGGAASSGGSSAANGGTSSGGTSSGGTSSGGASAGTGAAGGSEDAGAADAGPPGPTDAGTSVYALPCDGESAACGDPERVRCLGVGSPADPIGFACSNRCESVADCSTAPSGAPASVGCVQLTAARHCLLVCQEQDREAPCPSGMSCYLHPGSSIGYCLWQ